MRACRDLDPLFGNDLDVMAQALLAGIQADACVKGAVHFKDKTKAFVESAEII